MTLQLCNDKGQWDDYVLDHGGHPLQLWGWGTTKESHGWRADRLFWYNDDDEVVAATQVLTRKLPFPFKAFSYIPRGPVDTAGQGGALLDATAHYVKHKRKSIALSVEPATTAFTAPHGWHKAHNTILPAETLALDLKKPESQLLADMAKKTRQYIRKSAAEAIEIRQVHTKTDLKAVLDIYHQTAQRAKFNLHSDQYYIDVFNNMADNCIVFATYEGDTPLAFLWLAISTTTAFELYGGVTERGQQLRVNYAMKWHAIRKAKEWGLTTYDFGGLISGGISTFKQGWSNQETHLAGTFDKPLSPLYKTWTKGLPRAKKIVHRLKRK